MFKRLFPLAAFCFLVPLSFCQTLQDANALLNQKKFAEAASAFQSLTAADAGNGGAWLGLGQALEGLRQTSNAVSAYQKAIELKSAPKMAMLFTARTYAASGDQAKAYEWLTRLSESTPPGFLLAMLNASPQFAVMKDQPRFKEIQEKMTPCNSAEYHQFDFWIGRWEVRNPQDQPVGHNDVTVENSGCILQEHWASGRGVEKGTSLNFYDNRDKKWHQIYFDNSGNMGNYPPMAGELKDGRMVMLTAADQSPLSRWTWYVISEGSPSAKSGPGTKVRQWAEQSTDSGKTWTTTWDSIYVKQ